MHTRDYNASSHGSRRTGPANQGPMIGVTGYSLPLTGPLPSWKVCDEHNAEVGKDNWKEHISPWREYAQFDLASDGRVFCGEGLEEDEQLISRIHALAEEDKQIREARVAFVKSKAEGLFDGDIRAAAMFHCALAYGQDVESSLTKDGIEFYQVGRNASHEFFMGMSNVDGVIKCYSGAESEYDPFSYIERESWDGGYYGHH